MNIDPNSEVSPLEQLRQNRMTVGLAYVQAVSQLRDAVVELHAHDMALKNANVSPPSSNPTTGRFTSLDARIPTHSTFAADDDSFQLHQLSAAATARAEELIAQVSA